MGWGLPLKGYLDPNKMKMGEGAGVPRRPQDPLRASPGYEELAPERGAEGAQVWTAPGSSSAHSLLRPPGERRWARPPLPGPEQFDKAEGVAGGFLLEASPGSHLEALP